MRRRHLIGRVAASCRGALLLGVLAASAGLAPAVGAEVAGAVPARSAGEPILVAQSGGTTGRELEPAYPAPPAGEPGPYNESERKIYTSDYLFASTRAVARSTIVPAGKVPLFLLTVPVDLVCLPIALIAGFFG
jgi:Flp pilus assembly protein CpaB